MATTLYRASINPLSDISISKISSTDQTRTDFVKSPLKITHKWCHKVSIKASSFGSTHGGDNTFGDKTKKAQALELQRIYEYSQSLPKPLSVTGLSNTVGHGSSLRVAYQGVPGAYSESAAAKAYPNCEAVPCEQFDAAFDVSTSLMKRLVKLKLFVDKFNELQEKPDLSLVDKGNVHETKTPESSSAPSSIVNVVDRTLVPFSTMHSQGGAMIDSVNEVGGTQRSDETNISSLVELDKGNVHESKTAQSSSAPSSKLQTVDGAQRSDEANISDGREQQNDEQITEKKNRMLNLGANRMQRSRIRF